MKTVYYIVHKDSGRRLKWYKTRAGARIAQRARNSHLGFRLRLERTIESDIEYELCATVEAPYGVLATYCIVEDVIETNTEDLLSGDCHKQ
jgi:hypothetical protein